MEIINIQNLTFSYPNTNTPAVSSITFTANEGDLVILSGYSGSGKTTLLKCMKPEITPNGKIDGEILYKGNNITDYTPKEIASDVGYLFQNPYSGVVTDRVISELAFSMESLSYKQELMNRRIAEIVAVMGLNDMIDKSTNELSGGELQLVNLASILVTEPKVLLLDEPTAMLDPIAEEKFMSTIKKINKELNITIIYSTHNYNNLLDIADRLLVLDSGHMIANDTPKEALINLLDNGHKDLLNVYLRAWNNYGKNGSLPINMSELKDYLRNNYKKIDYKPDKEDIIETETVVNIKDIYFRYNRNSKDVIKSLTLSVNKGNVISILGGNGSGKSTLLSMLYSSRKPYKGKIKLIGDTSIMPQSVELIFTKDKVKDMLNDDAISLASDFYDKYKNSHPYDLSGGEKGLLGFLTAISKPHDILLLDEPTKGMDNQQKLILKDYILKIKEQGKTVITVTHDIEFAAHVSDKIGMMFDGNIVGEASPLDFFKDNIYYKPFISRVMKDIDDTVYLEEQLYEL